MYRLMIVVMMLMVIVCNHPITILTNKSKHFFSRLVYASSVGKKLQNNISNLIFTVCRFQRRTLLLIIALVFFSTIKIYLTRFFLKNDQAFFNKFSNLTLNNICKKIIDQFWGSSPPVLSKSDYMYCLFTAFLKKYQR